MPRVGYVYDPLYLEHGVPGHPETPARLQAIMSHLRGSGLLARLVEIEPRDATAADLELVHSSELIARVRGMAAEGGGWQDPDTYVVPRSYEAALRAAGGVLAATDAVLDGSLASAFCLVRPPGHHATPERAMGFCLFNNVALAAAHALNRRGLERVAIVDFDVHHGNGTQDAFYADPRVLYFSTHQHPFYPGSGYWAETGEGAAKGTTVNVPLPRGCGDAEYLRAYREVCAPAVRRFRPQLLLVSAGFDAHFADPLAQMLVSTGGYCDIATLLRELAEELCEGRMVYTLEGGYDHTALAWSVRACLDALLGNPFAEDPLGEGPRVPGPDIEVVLGAVKRAHGLVEG
ncbi:MAG TPA: histone deacetylase [Dehalococcoidia bacterium]|nr:histone deacetylase [Dehalococcoidia bacterium]